MSLVIVLSQKNEKKANGIRSYTNKVRLRGLAADMGFRTRVGGFSLYSCDFNRQVQDLRSPKNEKKATRHS